MSSLSAGDFSKFDRLDSDLFARDAMLAYALVLSSKRAQTFELTLFCTAIYRGV